MKGCSVERVTWLSPLGAQPSAGVTRLSMPLDGQAPVEDSPEAWAFAVGVFGAEMAEALRAADGQAAREVTNPWLGESRLAGAFPGEAAHRRFMADVFGVVVA